MWLNNVRPRYWPSPAVVIFAMLAALAVYVTSEVACISSAYTPEKFGDPTDFATAFLHGEGIYGRTQSDSYMVRVEGLHGKPGPYGIPLFETEAQARAYANSISNLGDGYIRGAYQLGDWNKVEVVRIYKVPKGTEYIQGPVGPQPSLRNPGPKGLGSQVVIDGTDGLTRLAGEYTVSKFPPASAEFETAVREGQVGVAGKNMFSQFLSAVGTGVSIGIGGIDLIKTYDDISGGDSESAWAHGLGFVSSGLEFGSLVGSTTLPGVGSLISAGIDGLQFHREVSAGDLHAIESGLGSLFEASQGIGLIFGLEGLAATGGVGLAGLGGYQATTSWMENTKSGQWFKDDFIDGWMTYFAGAERNTGPKSAYETIFGHPDCSVQSCAPQEEVGCDPSVQSCAPQEEVGCDPSVQSCAPQEEVGCDPSVQSCPDEIFNEAYTDALRTYEYCLRQVDNLNSHGGSISYSVCGEPPQPPLP